MPGNPRDGSSARRSLSRCLDAPRRRRSPAPLWIAGALALLALGLPERARAYDQTFEAGSLIIGMQKGYQSDCGTVSAYGLAYQLMRKQVPVNWVINPTKSSHDRCRNNDSTPIWNDGCDLVIQNSLGPPVTSVNNATGTWGPFTGTAPYYTPTSGPSVIKYMGAPFVISAADAPNALNVIATDPDLAPYRTACSCGGLPVSQTGCHYVQIHRAEVGFTAPIARVMNKVPSLFALVGAGAVSVLETYLASAGLSTPGDGGTFASHGTLYDVLEPNIDYISTPSYPEGKLNALDPSDPSGRTYLYRTLWAPHWVGQIGDLVKDGMPGDSVSGDGQWTDSQGRNDLQSTLANIALFAERGGGLFAECASIETFEGSWTTSTTCTSYATQCEASNGTLTPYSCPTGYTAGPDADCHSCSSGTYNTTTNQCDGTCPAGYVSNGTGCTGCKSGYIYYPSNNSCRSACPNGSVAIAIDKCASCPNGYTMDTTYNVCATAAICASGYVLDGTVDACVKPGSGNKAPTCPSPSKYVGSRNRCEAPETQTSRSSSTPVKTTYLSTAPTGNADAVCPAGQLMLYNDVCTATKAGSVSVPGDAATRFQTTLGVDKNGLNNFSGPNCTDPSYTGGDCLIFHDYGNPLTQIGNYSFSGTGGHIHNYRPSAGTNPLSIYRNGVTEFITSYNDTDATQRNWDFSSAGFKDGNPRKGAIVYLAGHSFDNSVAGTRLVLNTLFNLQFAYSSTELSRSEPVAMQDTLPNGTSDYAIFSGTYLQVPPSGPNTSWQTFDSTKMSDWLFPYISGYFTRYESANLPSNGQVTFGTNSTWEASEQLPPAGSRTIWTYLPAPTVGQQLNGVAGLAWNRVSFDFTSLGSSCLKATGLTNTCMLAQQIGLTNFASIDSNTSALAPWVDATEHLVQKVRGFCVAHQGAADATRCHSFAPGTNLDPNASGNCAGFTNEMCDNPVDVNIPSLGGIDHSTAAVIGPSQFLGAPIPRPTVAYVGGRDGMLHAFYVSGGNGYTGVTGQDPPFYPPNPGTELWAIIPPGQLPNLSTNNAMVDGSPVVVDAFGDFAIDVNGNGSYTDPGDKPQNGQRVWRTVLVIPAGRGGTELFALDISNPLKPALLWDVNEKRDNQNLGVDPSNFVSYAKKFSDGNSTSVNYDWPNTTMRPQPPPALTGRYNYADLGNTQNVSVGLTWGGAGTQYTAYVATNAGVSGNQALEVFAIDLVTGAKLWQFERPYAAGVADNTLIDGASVVDLNGDGQADRVYAGAMDGTLWELDAATGRNVNFVQTANNVFQSFPLYDTNAANQPISTIPTVVQLGPNDPSPSSPAHNHAALAFGTGGTDWALANNPSLIGTLSVVPYNPAGDVRYPIPVSSQNLPPATASGIVESNAIYVYSLNARERIYGAVRVANDGAIATTSYGSLEGNLLGTQFDSGRTLFVPFANGGTAATIATAGKSDAGALTLGGTTVVTQSVSTLDIRTGALPAGTIPMPATVPTMMSRLDSWFELARVRAW